MIIFWNYIKKYSSLNQEKKHLRNILLNILFQNLSDHASPDFGDHMSGVDRMSPYNSQLYYSTNNALHTPESSPNPHSPDPSQVAPNSRNRKLNAINGTANTGNMSRGKHQDDVTSVTSSLPTPEMSPLELEKENYSNSMSNDKQKISFMDYNGHIKTEKSGTVTPTSYAYSNTGNSNRNMNTFDMDSIEHHIIKREYNSYGSANSNTQNNSSSSSTDNKAQSNNSRSYR